MTRIRDYQSLLEEKERLEQQLIHQKQVLRADITEIQKHLEPAVKIIQKVGQLTSGKVAGPLLGLGLGAGLDVILRNTVFKNAGLIGKLGLPFLTKKIGSKVLNETQNKKGWLSGLINRFRGKKEGENKNI